MPARNIELPSQPSHHRAAEEDLLFCLTFLERGAMLIRKYLYSHEIRPFIHKTIRANFNSVGQAHSTLFRHTKFAN